MTEKMNIRDVAMACAEARRKVTGLDYSSLIETFSGSLVDRYALCDLVEISFREFEDSKSLAGLSND